ncbi:MAG: hypothetical protein AAF907_09200, partial [Planctomycetota bacterium]
MLAARPLTTKAIPDLTGFDSLRELTLGWFAFEQIPNEVFEITTLQTLVVLNCPITEVSDRIGQLSNLRALSIRGGDLRRIPNSVLELNRLSYLDLAKNQIARA